MSILRIHLFESIFKQGLGFKEPFSSAAYYTLLIEKFPTSFKACFDEANKMNITPKKLEEGREELLAKGLIAKIDLKYNVPPSVDFGREMYLPVNPGLIWEEYKIHFNLNAFKELKDIKESDLEVSEFSREYTEKFGINGFATTEGCITIYNSSQWLLFTLMNNLQLTKHFDLMLSGLNTFELPFRRYYEKMLNVDDFQMRVLYDASKINSRVEQNIKNLKDLFGDRLQIKETPVRHVTSRRVILHNVMAIDGRKLLNKEEPSYIGTIYLINGNENDDSPVKYLAENFNSTWDAAIKPRL